MNVTRVVIREGVKLTNKEISVRSKIENFQRKFVCVSLQWTLIITILHAFAGPENGKCCRICWLLYMHQQNNSSFAIAISFSSGNSSIYIWLLVQGEWGGCLYMYLCVPVCRFEEQTNLKAVVIDSYSPLYANEAIRLRCKILAFRQISIANSLCWWKKGNLNQNEWPPD